MSISQIKFHEKATILYGCLQKAKGSRVCIAKEDTSGTISVTGGSSTVTGTGTSFQVEATVGAYIYNASAAIIGRIASIHATLQTLVLEEDIPLAAITASAGVAARYGVTGTTSSINYSFGMGAANAIRALELNFSMKITTDAAQYVGDELDRYEQTWEKDRVNSVDFSTFVPALGAIPYSSRTSSGSIKIYKKGVTASVNRIVKLDVASGILFNDTGLVPTDINIGARLYTAAGLYIGTVASILTNTSAKLIAPAQNLPQTSTATAVLFEYNNTVAEVPLSLIPLPALYQAVGCYILQDYGHVEYTNRLGSNEFLELEYRQASPDLITASPYSALEKVYRIYDTQGTLDFDLASIGTRAKVKFTLNGNSGEIVDTVKIIADYGNQALELAETVNSTDANRNVVLLNLMPHYPQATVTFPLTTTTDASPVTTITIAGLTFTVAVSKTVTRAMLCDIWADLPNGTTFVQAAATLSAAQIADIGTFTAGTLEGYYSSTYLTGTLKVLFTAVDSTTNINLLEVLGTFPAVANQLVVLPLTDERPTPAETNICIDKLSAPNLFGFDFQRYMLSCETGFSKGAVPSDVTLTILENRAEAVYNPYANIGMEHSLYCTWGSYLKNSQVALVFNRVTLADVSPSKVATYKGQDLKFRNVGTFSMFLF